jgi:acyl carrier protein
VDPTSGDSPRSTLRHYILESFLFEPDAQLDDGVSLLGEGILDSTGVLDVVAYVEETFNIEVEDEELVPENFDSIRSLCEYVRRKTAERSD